MKWNGEQSGMWNGERSGVWGMDEECAEWRVRVERRAEW